MLSGCPALRPSSQGGERETLGLLCGAADRAALCASDGGVPAHQRLAELFGDGAESCQQAVGLLEVAGVHRGERAEIGDVAGEQRILQPIGQLTGFAEVGSKLGQRLRRSIALRSAG